MRWLGKGVAHLNERQLQVRARRSHSCSNFKTAVSIELERTILNGSGAFA